MKKIKNALESLKKAPMLRILIILLLSALFILVFLYLRYLNDEVNLLSGRIFQNKLNVVSLKADKESENIVYLSMTEFQEIGGGFNVSVKSAAKYLTGINIKGLILNLQSVTYRNPTFIVYVYNVGKGEHVKKAEFTVNKEIKPGHAVNFSAYIPDLPDRTNTLKIDYGGATVVFYEE